MSVVNKNEKKRTSAVEGFFGARFGGRLPLVGLLLCVALAFGCRSETNIPANDQPSREIADGLGRTVKLPLKVERAVSLAPNLTEIAFAVGAGDKLVGVTTFCDFPEAAREIQKIGDTLNPNVETIIALKPQVVLVSTASQMENFTRTLERQNIPVFVTNPNSLDEIYTGINQIGAVFSEEANAARVVAEMKQRVHAVEAKIAGAPKTKVFVQIDKNSLYTIGRDSFITDLITRAGGESLTKDLPNPYPNISRETALALNPEAIIVSWTSGSREPNEVFANSPAVKNGRAFVVNADWLARPAPRVVDGLEQIAKDLHPEKFQ